MSSTSIFWAVQKLWECAKNFKDSQLVDVSFENGQSITAKYVIRVADGSKSAVCIWTPSNQCSMVRLLTH